MIDVGKARGRILFTTEVIMTSSSTTHNTLCLFFTLRSVPFYSLNSRHDSFHHPSLAEERDCVKRVGWVVKEAAKGINESLEMSSKSKET